jgi:hypothetical protein
MVMASTVPPADPQVAGSDYMVMASVIASFVARPTQTAHRGGS